MTYVHPLLLAFLLIACAGLVRMRKCRGTGLAATGVAALFLVSWPPVDWLLSRPFEARYAHAMPSLDSAQCIVVLASTETPPQYGTAYAIPDKNAYERCTQAAWLHTHGHPLPILACEGAPVKPTDAETMRTLLQASGVPESMIWTERRSRNTHENAVFGSAVLREHNVNTIVLVTEAMDMLRAERCFRRQGLTVIPYPIAFRHVGRLVDELMPSYNAIARNERTLHEGLGLAWYWLHGWI